MFELAVIIIALALLPLAVVVVVALAVPAFFVLIGLGLLAGGALLVYMMFMNPMFAAVAGPPGRGR